MKAEGPRLWAVVAATVRPLPGREAPLPASAAKAPSKTQAAPVAIAPGLHPRPSLAPRPHSAPQLIEPGRHRRLTSGREALAGRIDLHGMDQDRARAALTAAVLRGAAEGWRSILVITGKGALGDGVLKRRVPDWLGEAPLRAVVAGLSEAHRRHGGAGALYVALKRVARRG